MDVVQGYAGGGQQLVMQRPLHRSQHPAGKFLQRPGVRSLGQGHRHGAGKTLQIQIILGQVVTKLLYRQGSLPDFPQKGMAENLPPNRLSFRFKLLAETFRHNRRSDQARMYLSLAVKAWVSGNQFRVTFQPAPGHPATRSV